MKNKIIVFPLLCIVFLIFSSLFFVGIQKADASLWDRQTGLNNGTIGKAFGETGTPDDPRDIVVRVILLFLTFMATIFVVLILFAGYKWMTASGNDEKIKEAKSQIGSAIIGLAIILASYGITTFMAEHVRRAVTGSIW